MPNTASEKYVFISDIHLGSENSYNPGQPGRYPYGWTNNNTDVLQAFLAELDSNTATRGAGGLVIVGDFLDTWICPLQLAPPSFNDVLSANHNRGVIAALNNVADRKGLWYVPGNHDMLIQAEPATIQNSIKNIKFLDPDKDGPKYFYDGRLVAEHGHQYCLFNAVDTWTKPPGHLPLGFFLARLSAEGVFEQNKGADSLEYLKGQVHNFLDRKANNPTSVHLGELVLDGLRDCEQGIGARTSPFVMNGVDNFGPYIAYKEVESTFGRIYGEWGQKSGSGISGLMAALGDTPVGLRWSADKKYLAAKLIGPDQVKIVLFGHTHDYEIKPGLFSEPQSSSTAAASPGPHEAEVIYGNCGAWVDSKPCTFIVTERVAENDQDRIYVRGYEYNKGGIVLRDDYFVVL